MWSQLFASVILCVAVLYVPGFFFFLSLGLQRSRALVFAPAFSIVSFSFLAIAYEKLGIFCSWINIVIPTAALGIICFTAAALLSAKFKAHTQVQGSISCAFRTILQKPGFPSLIAYLLVSFFFMIALYVLPLHAADSFINGWDNAHHMSVPRAFIESGIWSTLDARSFVDKPEGYYPSVNSLLPAILISMINIPVAIGLNATNIVMLAFVYPLGMWLFLSSLFGWHDARTFIGAVCCVAFVAFPWGLLTWFAPVLYAHFVAFVFIPPFCIALIDLLQPLGFQKPSLLSRVLALSILAATLALAHPCVFFSALLFVICYVAHFIFMRTQNKSLSHRILAVGAWLILCACVWIALFFAPFMQKVVHAHYDPIIGIPGGIALAFVLYTPKTGAQYFLGAIVIVGLVACYNDKNRRWFLLPYALAFCLAVVSFSFPDSTAKSFLTGFWYNHNIRLAANLAFYSMPIAIEGLYFLAKCLTEKIKSLSQINNAKRYKTFHYAAAAALLAIALLAPLPLPYNITFIHLFDAFKDWNSPTGSMTALTEEERTFCNEVYETIGNKPVILNITNDGSVYAYGTSGINTFDRSYYAQDDEDVLYLYGHLDEITTNEKVQQIAREHDVVYLLKLDTFGEDDATIYRENEDREYWAGLDNVDENTPGFEVVMAEGDMRLYRITALDKARG